jgi:hypothetical protein
MNKWEQITKLADAAELIRLVHQENYEVQAALMDVMTRLADIADQIEGFEEEE